MSNRLAKATSPYLLQHAGNPVDWYPWGQEAFSLAKAEDRPVLLSIGYSACHWCHVMAHESFENDYIAKIMNENFVNIKVDREERPDLDTIYMEAVQAMTGKSGWPLTVFLTPEGKPFFGGTYFPPEDKYGISGFPKVLLAVRDAYRSRRGEVEQSVSQITASLSARSGGQSAAEPLSYDVLNKAFLSLQGVFDNDNGGFGFAPKFPQATSLEFLLRHFYRTRDARALEMVNTTLENLARGGICDQVGGGFHRYSTDNRWLIPHFEKMLYDNALLSRVFLHAYLVSKNQTLSDVVVDTIDYVLREMTADDGAFYSTQDADSEGVEGKYYLWTPDEILAVLGESGGRLFAEYFGVTSAGNFEGGNVLHLVKEPDSKDVITIKEAKKALLKEREHRVRPSRDQKTIASWNGLMLSSLAEAACALQRDDYLSAAESNASFLINSMLSGDYLLHTCWDGKARLPGYLDDYAMVIEGLLKLYQVTLRSRWLQHSIALTERMVEQFWDETSSMFFDTGERHERLFIRPQSNGDGALPSGASVATLVLAQLGILVNNGDFQKIAERALLSMREYLYQHPLGFTNWLCTLEFYLSRRQHIVIVGSPDDVLTREFNHTICGMWLPDTIVASYNPFDSQNIVDLNPDNSLKMINDRPTAYLCYDYSCQNPVDDPSILKAKLESQQYRSLD